MLFCSILFFICNASKFAHPPFLDKHRPYPDCPAGTYVYNDESCESCDPGTYAPQALTGACWNCTAGDYTGVARGATTCSSCNAGEYSINRAVNCSTCGAGTMSETRASSCSTCDQGKWSGEKSSICSECEAGRWSSAGATSCTR
mmetsp:Transcript_87403/g.248078  ORF Transcript_87403/g.248078 Transcript_87403/m.248078 type:complete len:145 (-) Transcript_87403:3797-4231(-)